MSFMQVETTKKFVVNAPVVNVKDAVITFAKSQELRKTTENIVVYELATSMFSWGATVTCALQDNSKNGTFLTVTSKQSFGLNYWENNKNIKALAEYLQHYFMCTPID